MNRNTLWLAFFMVMGLFAQKNKKPNIVFLLIDDLGAESIGCYGGQSFRTPNIDKIATKGMKFTNAFSSPACMVSRAQLLSGRYGWRSGLPFNDNDVAHKNGGWGNNEVTIANVLQDNGYTTAIAGKWHLADLSAYPNHATDKGFEYQNLWGWVVNGTRTRRFWGATSLIDGKWVEDPKEVYGPDQYSNYIVDFIKKQKDSKKPFFAYYPLVLIHSPFPQTPDNLNDKQPGWQFEDNLRIFENQRWSRQNYKAMVEYADKVIGKVVDAIDNMGISKETMVIVTSDNGTIHGVGTTYDGYVQPGGKMTSREEGSKVPFIVYWKGTVQAGTTNNNLIDFCDILPTLAEVSGSPLPTKNKLDGLSFAKQLYGDSSDPKREWVYMGYKDKGRIRSLTHALDQNGDFMRIGENPYKPKYLKPNELTAKDKAEKTKLAAAVKELQSPYKSKAKSKSGGSSPGKTFPTAEEFEKKLENGEYDAPSKPRGKGGGKGKKKKGKGKKKKKH